MAVGFRITHLFLLLFISQVYCCYWSTKNQRQECDSLVSVSVEGNDTWSHLLVNNYKPSPFSIQANSFKKTPNLREITLVNVNEIELDAFAGLKKFDKLSIWDSFLDEVPKEVFANLPIRDIYLTNCSIKNIIPEFFENLPDVRQVGFKRNIMTEVKAGVFNNTPIYKLFLDNNLIESIEDNAFINMNNLFHLSLTGNRLTTFESFRVLGTNNFLDVLWLNKNKLTEVTIKMLDSVPNLKQIYFEINQIDDVEDKAFEKVPHIQIIDLSNNQLRDLRPRVFGRSGAKELITFHLHNNRLTFISKALFIQTPKLKYITYGGNPFQCPCLDNIKSWTANVTRICDTMYYSGLRPACINSEVSATECLYDVDLTKDLYDIYLEAIAEYPKLNLKCDTTAGAGQATLNENY